MFLPSQQKFSTFLDEVTIKIEGIDMDTQAITELNQDIKTREMLIPVIGGFSAGKSTLLNTFLGQNILPTSISPETELATELRYGVNECIVATKEDGSQEQFAITQFEDIKLRSEEFSHLCLYLNNQQLKNIEPIVLVDMPGFGSSLENHNKAINYYLPKGAYFIVVVSAEEGNITQSLNRQLSELHNLDRDFTILLSKANLRSPEQVQELKEYIAEQAAFDFDYKNEVIAIGQDSQEELNRAFTAINPNRIFDKLFKDLVKYHFNDVIDNINVKINALKNDSNKNQSTIKQLAQAISDLEYNKARLINDIKSNESALIAKRCVDYIGSQLNNHADQLANDLVKQNDKAFKEKVVGIIRDGLSYKLSGELKSVSHDVVKKFESEVSELSSSMSEFGMDDGWVQDLSAKIQKGFEITGSSLKKIQESLNQEHSTGGQQTNKEDSLATGKAIYRTITSIVAITTGAAAPIVEVALVFLPDIISFVNKFFQDQKIKEKVSSEVIPRIKLKLSEELPNRIDEQLAQMAEEVSLSFEAELREKKAIIEKLEKERQENLEAINNQVARYTAVRDDIMRMAEKALY